MKNNLAIKTEKFLDTINEINPIENEITNVCKQIQNIKINKIRKLKISELKINVVNEINNIENNINNLCEEIQNIRIDKINKLKLVS